MGIEVDETVRNRRISKPQHIVTLLNERINLLRKMVPKDINEAVMIDRAITNASNAIGSAMRDGEATEAMKRLEERYEEMSKLGNLWGK